MDRTHIPSPRVQDRPSSGALVDRLRPIAVTVLAAVTLFIWGNRIWLAWTNDDDTLAEKLTWSLSITIFVALAVILLVLLVIRAERAGRAIQGVGRVLAAGTTVFWLIRGPMIALADRPVGFKVVHAVLAVASIAAAVWAWRALDEVRTRPA